MKLPIIHFSPRTVQLSAGIQNLHGEISQWFDKNPERRFHILVPNVDLEEECLFEVAQMSGVAFDGLWIMCEEYGFVPYVFYSREPASGDQPECIIKRGLMVHSRFLMSDDDHTLKEFSHIADDCCAVFPVPRFIEKDEFWRCHEKNPKRLLKDLWS